MAQSKPIAIAGHAYDAATIDLLGAVLDETWAKLSQLQQAEVPRTRIAETFAEGRGGWRARS